MHCWEKKAAATQHKVFQFCIECHELWMDFSLFLLVLLHLHSLPTIYDSHVHPPTSMLTTGMEVGGCPQHHDPWRWLPFLDCFHRCSAALPRGAKLCVFSLFPNKRWKYFHHHYCDIAPPLPSLQHCSATSRLNGCRTSNLPRVCEVRDVLQQVCLLDHVQVHRVLIARKM